MAEKMQKIKYIEATIKLVSELGMENLRTKDIAKEAGLSEAYMYSHFENKEQVLRETFLEVDRRISMLMLSSPHVVDFLVHGSLKTVGERIWHDVFRYLLDHPDETVFIIRYRYSGYYTPEVRSQRMAYNSSFDKVYSILESKLGKTQLSYPGFIIGWVFEVTLAMAERIITGKIKDTQELENRVWNMILAAAGAAYDLSDIT